jgi:ATP/maltotriose-dependent transcriptional regulator MalT
MIARERLLMGLACRILADEEGATLELDAAREVFEELEAAPDLARLEALAKNAPACRAHRLTPRELQVLRLIATGKTNKGIAAEQARKQHFYKTRPFFARGRYGLCLRTQADLNHLNLH